MTDHPLAHVFDAAKGVSRLAEACGVVRHTPYGWKRIPAEHVLTVARITRIPRHELRPDIYPAPRPRKARA